MSGGGGSSTQAGGAAPTALFNAENTSFGNIPFYGINQAQGNAFNSINNSTASTAGQGQNLANQATSAYQAGQDPQNALFAKQFQQQQDQQNATNAMNGVAGTPYGAALTTQGNQNFDLNWQNQQLQRENTAANTASTLLGSGTSAQQQTIQDWLNYVLGNTTNASTALGLQNNTYADALGAAGLTNQAQQQSSALNSSSLAGLGSLVGSLAKLGLAS